MAEYLTINKDEFMKMLGKCIFEGKELYNKPIREDPTPNFRRKNINGRIYDEYIPSLQIEDFITQKRKWVSYTIELSKRSFNIEESEYKKVFEGEGVNLFPSGSNHFVEELKKEIKSKYEYLESVLERLPLIPCKISNSASVDFHNNSKRIFIVHGHDEKLRLEVENFLLRLDLEPVVLFKEPSEGNTIIEKIEKESKDVYFAIVIYSACDLGNDSQLVKTTADLHKRARQNVVFEHGYLLCKLGRNRVCALVEKDVETPGDMDGVVYIPTSNNWRSKVCQELKAAGIPADANKIK